MTENILKAPTNFVTVVTRNVLSECIQGETVASTAFSYGEQSIVGPVVTRERYCIHVDFGIVVRVADPEDAEQPKQGEESPPVHLQVNGCRFDKAPINDDSSLRSKQHHG
jgi:hypothetical protein